MPGTRLAGANALQLPINAPRVAVNNGNQDGAMNIGHTSTGVNYQPSRLESSMVRNVAIRSW